MYLESFQLRQASKEEIDSFEKLSWWDDSWYLVASVDGYYLWIRTASEKNKLSVYPQA